jgi:septal ring factor EnvC (AmiA/AmiB activator)
MDPKLLAQVKDWLGIAAILAVWTVGIWKAYASNRAEIEKVKSDLNNVGERANTVKANCQTHDVEIGNLKLEQQRSMDDRSNMRERIATNAKAIDGLAEELRADRLAVMSTLHANEKAAAERNAIMREELARIGERLNIERMIQSVVRSMKRDGNAES